MRFAWLTLPALLAAGCSGVFVSGPPAERPLPPDTDCTESNFWPHVDFAGAVLFGLSSITLFGLESRAHAQTDKDGLVLGGVVYGAATLAFGYSALRGYAKTSSCREALAEPPRASPPARAPFPGSPPGGYLPPSSYPPPADSPPAGNPPPDDGPRYYPTPTAPPPR